MQVRDMQRVMQHDPTYVVGNLFDDQLGLYVGWTARAGAFGLPLPQKSGDGRHTLLFSGEVYSDPEVARSHGDSGQTGSYLCSLLSQNREFFRELNGLFHGMAIDHEGGFATVFNDRFGMSRLYTYATHEAFYFAAEAKAILEVCAETRSMDERSLGEFVACGCVLENRTLFRGIDVLPAASVLEIRNGQVTRKGAYFSPKEWEGQELLTPEGYYQELKQVFSANLDRYFAGPHRYGISLTGGLDTRMIMAWKKFAQDSTPCYSFGSAYRDCEDVSIARRVARQCGQGHQIIEVGSDYLSRFPHYAERAVFLSDGTTPVNRGSDLYVNEIAKQIAPVRITGNYGGEVLRQVRAFKPGRPRPGLLSGDLDRPIQAAEQTYQGLIECHPLTFAVFRQATWHHYGLLGLEQTQVSMRTPYLDNSFVKTVFRAPSSSTQDNSVCLRLIADGDPAMAAIPTDRGLGGNSPALWTEMRHQILEFTFKAEYAYDYGMPQWVSGIDHALSFLHLERLFLGRHKFAHYRVWYRDQLAPYVREILLDSRSLGRDHIQRSMVETIVRDHTRGNRNYTSEIHVLLTLEHICRLFLDRKG